jgi:formate dehydrogenase subunit delta
MPAEKLVHMANQIGKFFAHEGEAKAAIAIADHLAQFWDPRMRKEIVAYLESGGLGLDPAVRQAVENLRRPESRTSTN